MKQADELSAASLRISESLDVNTVLHQVVGSARTLTGARYDGITALDEAGWLQDFVTSGLTPEEHQRLVDMPDGAGALRILQQDPGDRSGSRIWPAASGRSVFRATSCQCRPSSECRFVTGACISAISILPRRRRRNRLLDRTPKAPSVGEILNRYAM